MSADVTRIRIDIDDTFHFTPVRKEDDHRDDLEPTFEIDSEIVDEWHRRLEAFNEINIKFEQLYRIQIGKQPWPGYDVPYHKLLKKE